MKKIVPFIVKVQRSQFPSPKGGLYIYNEDQTVSFMFWKQEMPMIYREVSKVMGSSQKCYLYAHIEKNNLVLDVLNGRAPWQEW